MITSVKQAGQMRTAQAWLVSAAAVRRGRRQAGIARQLEVHGPRFLRPGPGGA